MRSGALGGGWVGGGEGGRQRLNVSAKREEISAPHLVNEFNRIHQPLSKSSRPEKSMEFGLQKSGGV